MSAPKPLNADTEKIITTIERHEREHRERLSAAAPDLLASLKDLLNDIDTGLLVRDITRDGEPGWALHMMDFVGRLQAAQAAIARAEGRV